MKAPSTRPDPTPSLALGDSSIAARLDRVGALLEAHADVVAARASGGEVPAWCAARGWDAWLGALGDEALGRCESLGLAASLSSDEASLSSVVRGGAPASLVELGNEVRACTELPRLLPEDHAPPALDAVGARKRWQIQALLDAAADLCREATRIVEVGAGRGHLTRIAAGRFERQALGIEREEAFVRSAEALAAQHGVADARFVTADALSGDLPLGAGDLALGLHACGEVGDHLVRGAARAGCHVALVACCAQKIRGLARAPLSMAASRRSVPAGRDTLGLANLGGGTHGIEAPVEASMAAREARWSLRWLLAERGVATAPGEEMRGVNRRRARGGLAALVQLALAARGLGPATDGELARCQHEGRKEFARVRRLALPRNMLGRALEVWLLLDRAQLLAETGHEVRAGALFPSASSPRNLALIGRAPR